MFRTGSAILLARLHITIILGLTFLGFSGFSGAGEWSGQIAVEERYFFDEPLDTAQHSSYVSAAFSPEYYEEWDNGTQSLSFIPFLRIDQHDDNRSHTDIRELSWLRVWDSWEIRLGLRKVFWGVTESQHLVDIINQSDLIEGLDGEEKLGQPMINFSWVADAGTLDLFVLPGFRERTFPGAEGRLRTHPRVDPDLAQYESSDEERHIDYAVRWTQSIGVFDLGLSSFYGTGRDPSLIPVLDGSGNPALAPRYEIIRQSGLDIQVTLDEWLWKLEAITRTGESQSYGAATFGFEYSLVGIADSAADLGIIVEYMHDDRGASASTPFEDDYFLGARVALNDAASTEFLGGIIADTDGETRIYRMEASRRVRNNLKLSMEAQALTGQPASDPFYSLRDDDYLQLELAWFF